MRRLLFVVFAHKNWETAPSEIASFELPRPPEPSEVALLRKRPFVVMTTLVEIASFELPRPPEPYEVALWCILLFVFENYKKLQNMNIAKLR